MNEPVRMLSDLHLGHRVSRIGNVEALRPLVAGAGTVIFNGDTWQELARGLRERSGEMLAELRKLCAEEGVETVFLPGNHDPGWDGDGWVELAGGRIVVTHGDALFFDGSPWKREVLRGRKRVMELWGKYPAAGHDIRERLKLAREISFDLCSVDYPSGRRFVQRAWDALVPPMRAVRMLEAWLSQGLRGAEFCERYFPAAEFLIIGHFHFLGCWEERGRVVIDTGSFLDPGRANWVEWSGGWLSRGVIEESAGACRMGARTELWRLD